MRLPNLRTLAVPILLLVSLLAGVGAEAQVFRAHPVAAGKVLFGNKKIQKAKFADAVPNNPNLGPFTIDPFAGNPGPARTIYGQQVYRELWFDGSYLYLPRTLSFLNIKAFERLTGADENYPPRISQDIARMELIGQTGHGFAAFYALTGKGDTLVDHSLLVPVLTSRIEGMSDLTPEGLVVSHWVLVGAKPSSDPNAPRPPPGYICVTHWIWPGGAVMTGEDAWALVRDPYSQASKQVVADIRRQITTKP